jgi:hypothetical protein
LYRIYDLKLYPNYNIGKLTGGMNIVVLFGVSSSRYSLLNALLTAAKHLMQNNVLFMNRRALLTSTELLRSWRRQESRKRDDIGSGVSRKPGRVGWTKRIARGFISVHE